MAVTSGHGNPNWTREETLLALELYFRLGEKMPSAKHQDVVELSKLLRSMEIHKNAQKNETFRNPDGVSFKIGNLRAVATNKGLTNTSQMDRAVWDEFGTKRESLQELCDLIRSGVEVLRSDTVREDLDEEVFDEGEILTKVHKQRERKKGLRKKLISKLKSRSTVKCEMCGVLPLENLGEKGLRMFECHHIVPLSEAVKVKTKLTDLSLLCANCHKLIHAAITIKGHWLTIEQARSFLKIKLQSN